MKAIMTKFLVCTDTQPNRIKAYTHDGNSLTLASDLCDGDGGYSNAQTHGYVASKLADKMGWYTPTNYLIGGCMDNTGYCFVFSNSYIIAPKEGGNS